MRPSDIVVGDLGSDLGAGVVDVEEQGFVEQLIAQLLKLSMKPFWIGFPGAMKY